jgi:hypothetical protein
MSDSTTLKTIQVTPEMEFAIKLALAELENFGDWTEFYTEEEHEKFYSGKSQLVKALIK